MRRENHAVSRDSGHMSFPPRQEDRAGEPAPDGVGKLPPRPLRRVAGILIVAATALIVPGGGAVHSQRVELVILDATEVAQGYRASDLQGKDVVNDDNETIGSIDDFIFLDTGKIVAILEIGGFLGLGGQLAAVSFDDLKFEDDGARVVLPAGTREELEGLEEFEYKE